MPRSARPVTLLSCSSAHHTTGRWRELTEGRKALSHLRFPPGLGDYSLLSVETVSRGNAGAALPAGWNWAGMRVEFADSHSCLEVSGTVGGLTLRVQEQPNVRKNLRGPHGSRRAPLQPCENAFSENFVF
jgi:hypothetical protein